MPPENKVTCYLTRNFIDVIKNLLTYQTNHNDNIGHLTTGNDIDETSMDEIITTDEQTVSDIPTRKSTKQSRYQQIPSEFGLKILQDSQIISQHCLMIRFDGLLCPDTSAKTKIQFYIYISCVLKIHDDNEPLVCTLLSLVILMYDTFQQISSNLFTSVLLKIPDVTNEQLSNYRDKIQRQLNVQPLMSQNVAQMFKRELLVLNNLPPLTRFSKCSFHSTLQYHQQTNIDNEDDHGLEMTELLYQYYNDFQILMKNCQDIQKLDNDIDERKRPFEHSQSICNERSSLLSLPSLFSATTLNGSTNQLLLLSSKRIFSEETAGDADDKKKDIRDESIHTNRHHGHHHQLSTTSCYRFKQQNLTSEDGYEELLLRNHRGMMNFMNRISFNEIKYSK
ncbi:unnamed protein product [Rotaria sp. Silwood1]|nr:unnamed protein product [Rotaria sp. Silwood1]